MLTMLDVYIAVIAGNCACLAAAWIWYKPKDETRTLREKIIAGGAVFMLIGMPLLYFFLTANPN